MNTKDKFTYELLACGSMDHPVWWDEKMVAVYRMENNHAAIIMLIISYVVKQCLKLDKLHILI
jgi:hypothetical protein